MGSSGPPILKEDGESAVQGHYDGKYWNASSRGVAQSGESL